MNNSRNEKRKLPSLKVSGTRTRNPIKFDIMRKKIKEDRRFVRLNRQKKPINPFPQLQRSSETNISNNGKMTKSYHKSSLHDGNIIRVGSRGRSRGRSQEVGKNSKAFLAKQIGSGIGALDRNFKLNQMRRVMNGNGGEKVRNLSGNFSRTNQRFSHKVNSKIEGNNAKSSSVRKSHGAGKFKTQMNFRGKKKERSIMGSLERRGELSNDVSLGSGKVKRKSRSHSRKKSRSRSRSKKGPKVFAGVLPENQNGRLRVRLGMGKSTPRKKTGVSHESQSTRAASMNPSRAQPTGKIRSGHSLSIKRAESMFNKKKEEEKNKGNLYVKKSYKGKTVFTTTKRNIKLAINGESPITLDPITVRKSNSVNSKLNRLKLVGGVLAYAAGTHNGIIRTYNEDRLAIVLNFKVRTEDGVSPCNFFGIYDGHGGISTADYLKNSLHKSVSIPNKPKIFAHKSFPGDIKSSIEESCAVCEQNICDTNLKKTPIDKAGSCALFCILMNNVLHVGNVGDSRALMSRNNGDTTIGLTNDHKPDDISETNRIEANGGRVYQTTPRPGLTKEQLAEIKLPWRVLPGRLSVSRTFGDVLAKSEEHNGKQGVIIAEPDYFQYDITQETDFVILCCDGVFDRLENEDVNKLVWEEVRRCTFDDVHSACEHMVGIIFQECVLRMSYDNISIIFLAFENFVKSLKIWDQEENEDGE